MRRLMTALKQDLKFQFRHGFYYVYLLVSLIYIIILRSLPLYLRGEITALIIFSDPAMLGFFFIGAIILLERNDNVLEQLFVTPLRPIEYIVSKVMSLTILGTVVSFAIALFSLGRVAEPLILLAAMLLTSAIFTLLGIIMAVRVNSVNQYILIAILYSLITAIPFVDYFQIYQSPVFMILPTLPAVIMIQKAVGIEVSAGMTLFSLINLLVWLAFTLYWASKAFNRYIIMNIGDQYEKVV